MLSLRSKITEAVLGYFMLHEQAEMYGLEIARRLGLDDGNLARKLKELEQEGILKCRESGRQRYYSLDKSFPLLKQYKQIILKTTGLEHLLRDLFKKMNGVKEAYLFGSYAANQMDSTSDIDVLAIGNYDTIELRKKLSQIQKTTDREINLVGMSPTEYEKRKKKKDSLIQSFQKSKKIKLI